MVRQASVLVAMGYASFSAGDLRRAGSTLGGWRYSTTLTITIRGSILDTSKHTGRRSGQDLWTIRLNDTI